MTTVQHGGLLEGQHVCQEPLGASESTRMSLSDKT